MASFQRTTFRSRSSVSPRRDEATHCRGQRRVGGADGRPAIRPTHQRKSHGCCWKPYTPRELGRPILNKPAAGRARPAVYAHAGRLDEIGEARPRLLERRAWRTTGPPPRVSRSPRFHPADRAVPAPAGTEASSRPRPARRRRIGKDIDLALNKADISIKKADQNQRPGGKESKSSKIQPYSACQYRRAACRSLRTANPSGPESKLTAPWRSLRQKLAPLRVQRASTSGWGWP